MSIFDFTFFKVLRAWYNSTQSCSVYSHYLMYSILISSVLIAIGGVFVWFRFIRSPPVSRLQSEFCESDGGCVVV